MVQNRRFLILPGLKLANLASKTLAMCLRVLADHWEQAFAYRPLVAETFVDPQIPPRHLLQGERVDSFGLERGIWSTAGRFL